MNVEVYSEMICGRKESENQHFADLVVWTLDSQITRRHRPVIDLPTVAHDQIFCHPLLEHLRALSRVFGDTSAHFIVRFRIRFGKSLTRTRATQRIVISFELHGHRPNRALWKRAGVVEGGEVFGVSCSNRVVSSLRCCGNFSPLSTRHIRPKDSLNDAVRRLTLRRQRMIREIRFADGLIFSDNHIDADIR